MANGEISNLRNDAAVARCPNALSTSEIIRRDGRSVPDYILEQSPGQVGDGDIAYDRYISRDFLDLEADRLWTRTWQWACRDEQIPEPGDYYVYDIGHRSFLIVRTNDGDIRAYYNSCMHRGTKLRTSGTDGTATQFRCPFHGWSWNIDGGLENVPCAWDFPHVTSETHKLRQVRVDRWGGFIFINMDADAPSLKAYMEVIPDHLDHFRLEDRYIALDVVKSLNCNWKAGIEAFVEAYHVMETHPQLLGATSDANGQFDIYGAHVSRRLAAAGSPSPHVSQPMDEQAILDFMVQDGRTRMDAKLVVAEGETARIVMARQLRAVIEEGFRTDLSQYADCEIIDTIEYHLFPNMMLFPNFGLSMAYRFLPSPDSPEKCTFELMFLRPCPKDGERPEPAERVFLTHQQSFSEVPGIEKRMADIYDQDTGNLAAQQEGFRVEAKEGETLGNYQEVRIRHFERTVDEYLAREIP